MNTAAPTGASLSGSARTRRILFPKEHGAYGQLIFPALTALLLGARIQGAGLALVFALVFLLHEPVLVLLGDRGPRAKQQLETVARRQCLLLVVAILAVFAKLGPLLSGTDWRALLLPMCVALSMAAFIFLGKERTTAGELTAAAGLSACCFPIAVADGHSLAAAGICWVVWAAVLMAATLAVRGVIARAKYGQTRLARLGVIVGTAGAIFAGWMIGHFALPAILLWAVAPAVVVPLVLWILHPSPKSLRTIGWSAMTVDFGIVFVMVAVLRQGRFP